LTTQNNLIEFGKRLQRARSMAHKTQAQVGHIMGCHATMVGHYEHARNITKMPPYDSLLQVAEYLNVDHDWLATGFESAPAPEPVRPLTIDEIANFVWDRPQFKNPRFSDLIELIRFAEARYQ
jgi:transcriptional regulator with XRE-family HTH domain